MQVLLDRMYGLRPRIVDFDARERMMIGDRGDERGAKAEKARPEAMLLIGDKVATDPPPSDAYPHQLDLGQAWKEITGMPFVYAMWMCRAAEAGSQKIRTAAALLDRQRRHNRTRLDWLVESRAPDRGWASEVARTYAGSLLRYEVGDAERGAVARFLEDAATLGLCPRRALIWAE
jgi:chorismate dehydratase